MKNNFHAFLFEWFGGSPVIEGFTLVELLIVVAIIGLMATIGVPTFKKMVQKAKKSEAKVALGALFTVENAFFAEYGVFGSNVEQIGFTLDGSSATRIYHVGFGGAACNDASKIAIRPVLANAKGSLLNAAFPSYYTSTYVGVLETTAGGAPSSGCYAGSMGDDGSSFIAAANGNITSIPGGPVDQWSLNNDRTLVNQFDGMK